MHVHDLHATVVYLMGFDREKLTGRDTGRDFRLTDGPGASVFVGVGVVHLNQP